MWVEAVFSATLLAFGGLAPGDALPNAPEAIWERLRELMEEDPDVRQAVAGIGWLTLRSTDGTGPTEVGLNEVKRHLEDFVERKLLVLVNRDDKKFLEGEVLEMKFYEKLDDGMFTVP